MNGLMREQIQNYAELIIKRGITIRRKPLIIQGSTEAVDFIHLLSEKAYKAGASHVEVIWQDDVQERLKYEYESLDMVQAVSPFTAETLMYYINQDASYLRLVSKDPRGLEGLDADKIRAGESALRYFVREVQAQVMEHRIRWCIAAVPGQKWAEMVFPDAEDPTGELWGSILKASLCDKDDPIGRWDRHTETMKQRMEKLNRMNLDRLQFTSDNGTDIVIGLCDGHRWRGGDSRTPGGVRFSPNIPTYELYTAPDKGRADGTVVSTKPLSCFGGVIPPGFKITYQNGKAIKVEAESKKDRELLESIFDSYDGSERLGEVAIVDYDNPISRSERLFYNTLFDENAACHLAMGNGISAAVEQPRDSDRESSGNSACDLSGRGLNQSSVHIDYMIGTEDMDCTGFSKDGREYTIMKNGRIVV